MAVTRGMRYLRGQGVEFAEHRYEHRVKGAAYAAEALALEPALVTKTLVAELDDGFAFALAPGDRELSLRGLARAAGSRGVILELASADLVCLLSPVAIGE